MKKKLLTALGGSLILLIGITAGALASGNLQEIKAFLNGDLKVRAHGEIVQLKDINGQTILPITYKGVTYLPVRSVASLLDVPVSYDATAKEVIIGGDDAGQQQTNVPISKEDYNNTLYTKDPALTKLGNKDYSEVLYSAPNSQFKYTALSPNGKYSKLVVQFAAIAQDVKTLEIRDIDTNALLKKVEGITPAAGLQTIEVNITGVKNISFDVNQPVDGGFFIPLTTSYYNK
ncbi:hypothetical protein ABE099_01120 [Paenibacillus turicensis]|uniref:stalk domain-containing protein n=1 Tax=Paenibacillus turicensis TaxID=160487 RepID=UPI003D2CC39C